MVNQADIVTPDGMPLVWALRLLYGIKQERVAGMNLLPSLLEKAEQMADKLEILIQNHTLREQMGKAGREKFLKE